MWGRKIEEYFQKSKNTVMLNILKFCHPIVKPQILVKNIFLAYNKKENFHDRKTYTQPHDTQSAV
jgi:hypothetical protein